MKLLAQVNVQNAAFRAEGMPTQHGPTGNPGKVKFGVFLCCGVDAPTPNSHPRSVKGARAFVTEEDESLAAAGNTNPEQALFGASQNGEGGGGEEGQVCTVTTTPDLQTPSNPASNDTPCRSVFMANCSVSELPNLTQTHHVETSVAASNGDRVNMILPAIESTKSPKQAQIKDYGHARRDIDAMSFAERHHDAPDLGNATSTYAGLAPSHADLGPNLPATSSDYAVPILAVTSQARHVAAAFPILEAQAPAPATSSSGIERHFFNSKLNSLSVRLNSSIFGTITAHFAANGEEVSIVVSSTDDGLSGHLSELQDDLKRWVEVFEPVTKPDTPLAAPHQYEALESERDIKQGATSSFDFPGQRQDREGQQKSVAKPEVRDGSKPLASTDQTGERWRMI